MSDKDSKRKPTQLFTKRWKQAAKITEHVTAPIKLYTAVSCELFSLSSHQFASSVDIFACLSQLHVQSC